MIDDIEEVGTEDVVARWPAACLLIHASGSPPLFVNLHRVGDFLLAFGDLLGAVERLYVITNIVL